MYIRKSDKKWAVLYSHCHGDIGCQSGLTYKEAVAYSKKLDEPGRNQHLDWAQIIYLYD
jgi:hypothetical protein